MSKYVITCEDVSRDGGEFQLVCEKDEVVMKQRTEYSFEDVLIDCYEFFRECCEDFQIDTRFDSIVINIVHELP